MSIKKVLDTSDMLYSIKVRKNEITFQQINCKEVWKSLDFKTKKMIHKELKYLYKLEEIEMKLQRKMYGGINNERNRI